MVSVAVSNARLPLEDAVFDVINKARKGLHLSWDEIAERSGVSVEEMLSLEDQHTTLDEAALKSVAFVLHLHADSLIALAKGKWAPQPQPPLDGLAMFTTCFGDMTVNAYLIWDPATKEAASFDTGASCAEMLEFIQKHQLQLKRIFITHTHLDHLQDIDALQRAWPSALGYGSAVENPLGLKPLKQGDGLTLGKNLTIRVLGTSGHTPGGLSYWVQGLSCPVVVVGDALFASSMGGAPYAYQEARLNNRDKLLTLPPETVVCPGHGPLTTVGEERAHNPFFPECKADWHA